MPHLTLQEVIDKINDRLRKAASLGDTTVSKVGRTRFPRVKDQPHRPEFYVPRITRRLVNLAFGSLGK